MPKAKKRETRAVAGFDPIPSYRPDQAVEVDVVGAVPPDATVVGLPAFADGDVPDRQPFDRATMLAAGFEAARGQVLVLPRVDAPLVIEVGLGSRGAIDTAAIRDAAAAVARAAVKHEHVVVDLGGVELADPRAAGLAVVEGALLARYRYRTFRGFPDEAPLRRLTIVAAGNARASVRAGARRGAVLARAANLARDLGNTPATHLTATRLGEVALEIGPASGLEVDVHDQREIVAMGLGGLLGVNAGSAEEARFIRLTYRPEGKPRGHRARRQGDHVRRRRHQPQAVRRDARAHEARHVGRRRDPRRDDDAA